jgi:hypothetical protein
MRVRDRQAAEAAFNKKQMREADIDAALKQEAARRDLAVQNMQRLRALRIQRENQLVDKIRKRA